jgi:SAM-dependent methyltransferase
MSQYHQGAEFYDLLYAAFKDYAAEAELLTALIRRHSPAARSILDVGCGTGKHAEALAAAGFAVDGVDLEPEFVALARTRGPGTFVVADMETLALPAKYDVVLCLFSAIGYVGTVARLEHTIGRLARHLNPGGLLVVEPWFEPGQLTDRLVMVVSGQQDSLAVARVSRTLIEGTTSVLEFEYLIGRPSGIERRSERHELGLFTEAQMEAAFGKAGLSVERQPGMLQLRGLYLGRQT